MGQLFAEKATTPAASGPTGSDSQVFLSSHVLEAQLDGCRKRRVDVLKVNARTRQAIAEVSFEQLLEEESWQLMVADLAVVPVLLEAKREPQQLHIPIIVQTAEAIQVLQSKVGGYLSAAKELRVDKEAIAELTSLLGAGRFDLLMRWRCGAGSVKWRTMPGPFGGGPTTS